MNKAMSYIFKTVLIVLILFLIVWFFMPARMHSGKEEGAPEKTRERTSKEFALLQADAFVYGAFPLINARGRLLTGSPIWVCEKKDDYIKLCDDKGFPSLYIRPDTELKPIRPALYPQSHIINATKNYIDVVFHGAPVPAALVEDTAQPEFVRVLFLYSQNNTQMLKQDADIDYNVFIDHSGPSYFSLAIKKKSHCGIKLRRARPHTLRIELKSCEMEESPIIAIDPGHGGSEQGTCREGICEKDVALKLAKALASALEKSGYRTMMLRNEDVQVSLQERLSEAQNASADLLVSLHFDNWVYSKSLDGVIKGTSCYYFYNFLRAPADTICDGTSLHKGSPAATRLRRSLYIVSSFELPSVLVEVANFASDPDFEVVKNFDAASVAGELRARIDRYYKRGAFVAK